MISVRKAEGCMGSEVSGIDLSAPLSDHLFAEVREALHRHHVLVFRAQAIEPAAFLGFARRFGRASIPIGAVVRPAAGGAGVLVGIRVRR